MVAGEEKLSFFAQKDLIDLESKRATIEARHNRMMLNFMRLRLQKEKAQEYAQHGFMRRFGTLRRCIDNAFALVPPSTEVIPEKNVLYDAQINVQAFFANVYGSIDNLAWMWVYEKGLEKTIDKRRVGLREQNTQLRATLSTAFQDYLRSRDDWMQHVIEYRDALAHRVPLYIPPGNVRPKDVETYNRLERQMNDALNRANPDEYRVLLAEQSKLLFFRPVITHSATETTALYPFHVQMIADFLTIEEFGFKMLAELGVQAGERR